MRKIIRFLYSIFIFFILVQGLILAEPELNKNKSSKVNEGKVPLLLDIPKEIKQGPWPISFGVPFPKGTVQNGDHFTVLAGGKAIPTQTSILSFWDENREKTEYIRWLLVDFNSQPGVDPEKGYVLLYRQQKATKAIKKSNLRLIKKKNKSIIHTGRSKFTIQYGNRFGIKSIEIDGKELLDKRKSIDFFIEDQKNIVYNAIGDIEQIVEAEGPCRIALKYRGWYQDKKKKKLSQHIIRLKFFENSSRIHLLHTFIFSGTSESHQLRDLGMSIPLKSLKSSKVRYGTDAEQLNQFLEVKGYEDTYLAQDCENRWKLKYELYRRKELLKTGTKTGGWMSAQHSSGSVAIALRDAWQNYPNEMEVKKGKLLLHFWPKHGRMLDFRTRAVLWPYGEEGIQKIDNFFQKRLKKPYSKSIDDIHNNAFGLAKTHEVWLDFSAGVFSNDEDILLAHQAQNPAYGLAHPEWNGKSLALGPLHHYDPKNFPESENMLESMFDRYIYWRDLYQDYGWFDYSDVHCHVRSKKYAIKTKDGYFAQPYRAWDSTHYGFPNSPWLLFLRSGKRKYLEFAEANSRHCMDIDRCHLSDGKRKFKGAEYYCDNSIIHWNNYHPDHINYNKLEYMAYAYYIRGYQRALNVLKDWGDGFSRVYLKNKSKYPFQMIRPPKLKNKRHYGPVLGNMVELYRLTFDKKYLKVADRYADAIIKMLPQAETLSYFSKYAFCFEGEANYLRLNPENNDFRSAIKFYTRRYSESCFTYKTLANAWLGYYAHGRDLNYLNYGKANMVMMLSRMNKTLLPEQRGSAGTWVCGLHPYAMRSLPVMMAALADAPKEWRENNLPIVPKNKQFYIMGEKYPKVCLKSEADQPGLVRAIMYKGWTAYLDDYLAGKEIKAYRVETEGVNYGIIDIEVPPGTTAILSLEGTPQRSKENYTPSALTFVSIQNCKLSVTQTMDNLFNVFSTRVYFHVPTKTKKFRIYVDTNDTWAVYDYHPKISLYSPDGQEVDSKTGPGFFTLKAEVGEGQDGRLWSLGPIGAVSAVNPNKGWAKPFRPVDSEYPVFFELPESFPQFVTSHPDLFFIPN